jgi:hypothetical protein
MDRSASVLRIVWGDLFSGVVALLNSIDDHTKGCHVRIIMSMFGSCVPGFSCTMYIDLNHCDSQI